LFATGNIRRAFGRIMMKLKSRDIESGSDLGWVLDKIGVGSRHRHQAVLQCLVTPGQRIGFTSMGVDRRVANILKIDEYRKFLGITGRSDSMSILGHPYPPESNICVSLASQILYTLATTGGFQKRNTSYRNAY